MENSDQKTGKRIAILVDAESISADNWPAVARIFDGLGDARILTCFGDFTNPANAGWLAVCRDNGGSAEMVLGTGARNGSDIALTVEAMELIHADAAEMIVIVSSDSDFAPLARAITASGRIAVGIGHEGASNAFSRAFDRFIPLPSPAASAAKPKPAPTALSVKQLYQLRTLVARLAGAEADGSVPLSRLGYVLKQDHPELAEILAKGRLRKALNWYGLVTETGKGTAIRVWPRAGLPRRDVA